jgi:hypothetical protein
MSSDNQHVDSPNEGWQPISPEHWALYEQAKGRARTLLEDEREEVAAVAGDSIRLADEALALWGSVDALIDLAEKKRNELALLRRGIEDAIHALTI